MSEYAELAMAQAKRFVTDTAKVERLTKALLDSPTAVCDMMDIRDIGNWIARAGTQGNAEARLERAIERLDKETLWLMSSENVK